MRSLLVLAALLLCFALTPLPATHAQTPSAAPAPPPQFLTIVVPEAYVRCVPSDQVYPTAKLLAGDKVEVLGVYEKDPTWLKIHPPPGSFSWINGRFVTETKENNKIGLVHAPDDTAVQVLAGSTVLNQEPSVKVAEVQRGSLVTILGSSRPTDKGPLLPIAPTPSEVRYIKASEVKKVDFPGTTPDPNAKETADKIARAEQSVRDARKHLEDAYNATTDPLKRQEIQRNLSMLPIVPTTGAPAAGPPNNTTQPGTVYHTTAVGDASKAQSAGPVPAAKVTPANWSPWGFLRKAHFANKDGQPMYVLTTQQGDPLVYAVPEAGKTLEPNVGRYVSLYGVASDRNEIGRGVTMMTVSHVGLPPP
jgi:hypothetical protein